MKVLVTESSHFVRSRATVGKWLYSQAWVKSKLRIVQVGMGNKKCCLVWPWLC